jgi:hypothetical protein
MRIRGALPLLLALLLGCQTSPEVDPRYRPAESILELLAVLQQPRKLVRIRKKVQTAVGSQELTAIS